MKWGEIYQLGVLFAEISAAAEALWLREVRAQDGGAPEGFKLILRSGPAMIMTEVPRVVIEVSGIGAFEAWTDSVKYAVWAAVNEMMRCLDGGKCAPVTEILTVALVPAEAVEKLMNELTKLAVGFCGQPERREDEPRFSLFIESLGEVITVYLEFENVQVGYETGLLYRQAVFTSSGGLALDSIADVLAQAQAHLESKEKAGW